MATNKEFSQAQSFYRAKIQNSISSETWTFGIAVDKMPSQSAWMLTISPNTEREELVLFTAGSYTPWLPWALTIHKRWINPTTKTKMSSWIDWIDYNNISYIKSHYKLDEIRMDVNHIHLNEKASIYDIDDIKALYASTDSGKWASLIWINDSWSHFTSATVEWALTELAIWATWVADATTTTPWKSTLSTITQIKTSTDTDGTHPYVVQPSWVNTYVNSFRASDAEALAQTDTSKWITPAQSVSKVYTDIFSKTFTMGNANQWTTVITHNFGRPVKSLQITYFLKWANWTWVSAIASLWVWSYDWTTQKFVNTVWWWNGSWEIFNVISSNAYNYHWVITSNTNSALTITWSDSWPNSWSSTFDYAFSIKLSS